jgi:hypothetical protein
MRNAAKCFLELDSFLYTYPKSYEFRMIYMMSTENGATLYCTSLSPWRQVDYGYSTPGMSVNHSTPELRGVSVIENSKTYWLVDFLLF